MASGLIPKLLQQEHSISSSFFGLEVPHATFISVHLSFPTNICRKNFQKTQNANPQQKLIEQVYNNKATIMLKIKLHFPLWRYFLPHILNINCEKKIFQIFKWHK